MLAQAACALFAPLAAPYGPNEQDIVARLRGPSWAHLLGTDNFGRDVLSRVLFGGRTSLTIGALVVVATSLIGTFIGITPGLGGAVAQWMAYGHATQSARTPEERKGFGQGDVRGVIGPGAACNSKEGGALIPTIAFGVPGSTSMAILLGGFFLLGLVPGPDMLTKHLPLTFSLVWTIVLANLITVAACFLLLNRLTALTAVPGHLLVPVILVLVFIGSYTSNSSYADIVVTIVFGAVGYFMVVAGWPRSPLVLGLVLGKIAENYLYISVARYDAGWLTRPVVLVLLAIAVGVILYPAIQAWRARRRHA